MTDKEEYKEATIPEQETGGGYSSRWEDQIQSLWQQYQNREPFSFDVNEDALYRQYKDQYIRQGRLAMEDTLGKAASLTGGYGNSYAENAGQQAYGAYLQGLNDRVPELYQAARDRYDRAGEDLIAQLGMMTQMDDRDYDRYQAGAELARYQAEAMASLGTMPPQTLLEASGLSPEYVQALLKKAASTGGGGGSRKKKEEEEEEEQEGPGISTDRNQGTIKASAWDYTLHTLDRLLAAGRYEQAENYLGQVEGQMNNSQREEAEALWKSYK